MSLDEKVSELIKRIYCAGNDAAEWKCIADEILLRTGGCRALTTLVDLSNREFDTFQLYGGYDTLSARGLEEYKHTHHHDPSLAWASRNPLARFCDSSQTVKTGEYLEHHFVKWNRAHFGSTHWYVGYTAPEEQLSYSFSVHFPVEQGPGNPVSLRLFRMLFDHLQCAMWLGRRPFNPDSDGAYLLLDRNGNVREISRGATAMLAGNDGLTITNRRIDPGTLAGRTQLDAALAQVSKACSTGTATKAVKLERPSGRRPWLLMIKPLISNFGAFGKVHCELLVHVHDGKRTVGSLDLFQGLFGLTERETQVMHALAEGHSIGTLAHCLKISPNTAKVHLRSIFAKTGTSRQVDLLQLCTDVTIR
ncbi:MAG: helix-turn-helix transcriptional regulator [Sphingomicrobium sp.]